MEYSLTNAPNRQHCIYCTDTASDYLDPVSTGHKAKVGLKGRHPWCGHALGDPAPLGPPWVQSFVAFSTPLVDLAHGMYPWSWASLVSVWACPSFVLGPVFLVNGLSPIGLMLGVYHVAFLAYSKVIFHIIPTGPPANEQSPKLMEYVSVKPYSLGLVIILCKCWVWYDFSTANNKMSWVQHRSKPLMTTTTIDTNQPSALHRQ
jgi:hypothetical protein